MDVEGHSSSDVNSDRDKPLHLLSRSSSAPHMLILKSMWSPFPAETLWGSRACYLTCTLKIPDFVFATQTNKSYLLMTLYLQMYLNTFQPSFLRALPRLTQFLCHWTYHSAVLRDFCYEKEVLPPAHCPGQSWLEGSYMCFWSVGRVRFSLGLYWLGM